MGCRLSLRRFVWCSYFRALELTFVVRSSEIVDKAFSRFDVESVVKMAKLKKCLNVMELFHGPTLAFKDLAMSCVGQLLDFFLNKRQKHITIIVGKCPQNITREICFGLVTSVLHTHSHDRDPRQARALSNFLCGSFQAFT